MYFNRYLNKFHHHKSNKIALIRIQKLVDISYAPIDLKTVEIRTFQVVDYITNEISSLVVVVEDFHKRRCAIAK